MEYKRKLRAILRVNLKYVAAGKKKRTGLVHFLREPNCTVSHFSNRAAAVFN